MGNAPRRLTIDEEIIALAPVYGTFSVGTIKAKIGEKVGLSGDALDTYCSFIEKSIENMVNGYLWSIEHPINGKFHGYMLSTKGLQLNEHVLHELEKGTVCFYQNNQPPKSQNQNRKI